MANRISFSSSSTDDFSTKLTVNVGDSISFDIQVKINQSENSDNLSLSLEKLLENPEIYNGKTFINLKDTNSKDAEDAPPYSVRDVYKDSETGDWYFP